MKKLFFSILAFGALLLTGCQEEIGPVMQGGNVTFTIQTPDVATKAIGDGMNVDIVHYEIYMDKAGHKNSLTGDELIKGTVQMSGKAATLSLNLLEDQNYVALFWAQVEKDAEGNTNTYYDVADLRTVKVNYPEVDGVKTVAANDESRAAFYKKYTFSTETSQEYEVTLVRPFAQLNLGTTQESLTIDYTKVLEESQVAVSGVATEFNMVEEKAENVSEDVLYAYAAVPTETLTVNEVAYAYAGMNYFLVPSDEGTVDITYDIKTDVGTVNRAVSNVPVKKNYRTNIIGNLLTKETVIEIVVDEKFAQPDYVFGEEWAQTGDYTYEIYEGASATALKEVLDHADAAAEAATKSAGPVVTINLAENVEWETGAAIGSTPLLDEESLISEVIINGNGKTFTATGKGVGKIRLANGGKLIMKNLKVVDLSVSYAENNWEYGYLEFGGVIRLEDCEVVNAIMFSGETAAFKGCSFNSNKDSEYAVWVDNGSAYFTDCTFAGARGLKMHEAYGSEVVKVSVNGCTFGPLTVKPGMAIGTVNAETTVIVKNSFFFGCQAGDQGLYMYETDTDVTTFNFISENNEVHTDPTAMLTKWIADAAVGDVINLPAGEYTLPAIDKAITLNCAEGTVFTGCSSLNVAGSTIEGATFVNESGYAVTGNIYGTFKGCTFDASEALRWCYVAEGESAVFEDCVFKTDFRGFHSDNMAGDVTFRRCEINGFNAFGGNGTITFEECTMGYDESRYNGLNIYSNTVLTDCTFNYISGKTNFIDMEGTGKTLTINNCVATLDGEEKPIIDFVGGSKLSVNTVLLNGKTYVSSQEDLLKALKNGATNIYLKKGNYEFAENPTIEADNVVIEGSDKESCVLKILKQLRADGKSLTLMNLTTDVPTGLSYTEHDFAWIHYFKEFNMINCNSNGRVRLNCYSANIVGCNFDVTTSSGFDGYGIFYYGPTNSNVKVKDCVFTTVGKAIVMYNESNPVFNLDVEECTFTSSATTDKAAIQMHTEYGISGVLNINNCTADGFADVNGGLWNELNNNTKVPTYNFTVTIDDATVQAAGFEKVSEGVYKKDNEYNVTSAAGLAYFSNKTVDDGTILNLISDIDFNNGEFMAIAAGYGKSLTFNGNNHTISNINLVTCSHNNVGAASLFFCFTGGTININDLTVDGATSEGATYCGAILGYTQGNATIKNVTVQNSTISGVKKIGGIVGFVEASTTSFLAEKCKITNTTVTATEKQAGTIIGYNAKPATLKNCTVEKSTATAPEYCDGGVRSTDPAQAELIIE